jgi:hypothetical protein
MTKPKFERIIEHKVSETADALFEALKAVDPPDETAIYVLLVIARTIAYSMGGPKRGAEFMHEMVLRICPENADDMPAAADRMPH